MNSETGSLAQHPLTSTAPLEAQQALLLDAAARDRVTARRACLLRLLWHQRFLTRRGLIARVEGELGKGCFGEAAWEDTFYRDMRAVRRALEAAGYQLRFSRSKDRSGYYLDGEPRLHPDLVRIIAGSLTEVDPKQIAIYRSLTPADRFLQGCSISDTARRAVAHRLRKKRPELTEAEALRLALRDRT